MSAEFGEHFHFMIQQNTFEMKYEIIHKYYDRRWDLKIVNNQRQYDLYMNLNLTIISFQTNFIKEFLLYFRFQIIKMKKDQRRQYLNYLIKKVLVKKSEFKKI